MKAGKKRMSMKSFVTIGIVLISLGTLTACNQPAVNRDSSRQLTTVASVDLRRYLGTWYEIARFDHPFERGCVGVTATYSENPDGTIRVVNRCRKQTLTGPEDSAEGTARIQDRVSNAKLSVTFFWPFEGDYWILALGPNYEWALVGEPSGRYLWILSRTPRIDDPLRQSLVVKLATLGYKTDALIWVQQPLKGLSCARCQRRTRDFPPQRGPRSGSRLVTLITIGSSSNQKLMLLAGVESRPPHRQQTSGS